MCNKLGWTLVAVGWSTAWMGIGLAYYAKEQVVHPTQLRIIPCDTDTDCMEKNGGDGGPMPRSEWHNEDAWPVLERECSECLEM